MSPIGATYIGFFVAILVLLWGVIELSQRYYRGKKVNRKVMNAWVPLHLVTHSPDTVEPLFPTDAESQEEPTESGRSHINTIHSRAQQNGHYSESPLKP